MSKPLSETTTATFRATVPALAAHRPTITAETHGRLLRNAHIRALRNQSNQEEAGLRRRIAILHADPAERQFRVRPRTFLRVREPARPSIGTLCL